MTSVSLPEQVIECLDALAERTGRARGVYLRIATTAMQPHLEVPC
ncbi:ribbon-helix-helix protein, CopG family [Micrococcus sp. M4NT]